MNSNFSEYWLTNLHAAHDALRIMNLERALSYALSSLEDVKNGGLSIREASESYELIARIYMLQNLPEEAVSWLRLFFKDATCKSAIQAFCFYRIAAYQFKILISLSRREEAIASFAAGLQQIFSFFPKDSTVRRICKFNAEQLLGEDYLAIRLESE